jgi:hypothetical protein
LAQRLRCFVLGQRPALRSDRQAGSVKAKKGGNQGLVSETFERFDGHGAMIGEATRVFEIPEMETLKCLVEIAHDLPFDGGDVSKILKGSPIETETVEIVLGC